MKQTYSTDQLVSAYTLNKAGISLENIAKETGIRKESIKSTLDHLEKNKALPVDKISRRSYKNAVIKINALDRGEQTTSNGKTEKIFIDETDNLKKLETLFKAFTAELVEIIDNEAKKRAEEEVTTQKERYEKELQRLQAIIVDAQNSSVVGLIRKKWGQHD